MPRSLYLLLGANLILLLGALRHNLYWGTGEVMGLHLPHLLGIAEGVCLLVYALVGGAAFARTVRGTELLTVRQVMLGGVLLAIVAMVVPPFLSTDVYDNLARGRVEAVHGLNPYVAAPAEFPEDDFTRAAQWTGFGNPYGPLFTVVQTAVCFLSLDRVWLGVAVFKLLFAACHILTGWFLFQAARRVRPEFAGTALLLYLWNPWILLETVGHAHNDALTAVGLAGMMWALTARKMALATVAFGLAVLAKHGVGPLGPLLLALAWRQRQLKQFVGGVAIIAVLTAWFVYHYFLEPGAIEALLAQAEHQRTSLQFLVASLLGIEDGRALTLAGIGGVILYLAYLAPRTRTPDDFALHGAKLMMLFILVAMPMFSPWYHLWWLPLLITLPASARAVSWLAVLGSASYLVFATTRSLGFDHQVWQWAVGLVPVAVLVLACRVTAETRLTTAVAEVPTRTSSSSSDGMETPP
ncbi:MAG: glycosyltransferase 87 family protein [bacterium]|nr:glycosyltransferase 87 family protein [bacterium]